MTTYKSNRPPSRIYKGAEIFSDKINDTGTIVDIQYCTNTMLPRTAKIEWQRTRLTYWIDIRNL